MLQQAAQERGDAHGVVVVALRQLHGGSGGLFHRGGLLLTLGLRLLEAMNAYERHVIHAALQDVKGVTTYSVGTEPNRRVVVAYDRGENN